MRLWHILREMLAGVLSRGEREYERRSVATAADLRIGDRIIPCLVRDVSAGGARVTPLAAVVVGATGVLAIPGTALQAAIRVVRQEEEGYALAFQSDEVGAIMAGWIRAIGDQRSPQ